MDVTTISVPLGPRSYQICIAPAGATDMAQKIAAALGKPTGVAVLVDGRVGQLSPRVQPLVEALAARLPQVRRLRLSHRERPRPNRI